MRRILPFMFLLLMVVTPLAVAAQQVEPAYIGQQIYHTVQYGETLYSIALWYGVTPEAIAAANGIFNYNYIFAGQQLLIPSSYTPPPPTYTTYTVRRGDTLASIARFYNTTVAAIAQLNGIYNVNRIYTGMLLYIPSSYYPPQPEVITYYVRYGDTLGRIARYYGVSIQSIVAYNGIINPNRIYAGMALYIPLSNW